MSGESVATTMVQGVLMYVLHVGMEYEDTVVLGSGMTVPGQYFGVASSTYHFEGFDGVLGYASL